MFSWLFYWLSVVVFGTAALPALDNIEGSMVIWGAGSLIGAAIKVIEISVKREREKEEKKMGKTFLDMLCFIGKISPQRLLTLALSIVIGIVPLGYGIGINCDTCIQVGIALFIIGIFVFFGAIADLFSGREDEHKNWLDRGKIK